ncbi:hypothetical protein [Thermococcus peptonophilus]|uniref:hypothetical protein n=1 Tax=Thermococcus peptonophilus TaxID=53952 RepID=UPI0006D1D8F6
MGEYYYSNLVLSKGVWEISTFKAYNTVASINILAPLSSLVTSMNLVSIFKVMYPFIFSLVPVVLLKAYEMLLQDKLRAELSVLFFMFLFTFFTEMMALARQMIAEVYLALLVYATIRKINSIFLSVFLVSLVISHYGTAYLAIFALVSLLLLGGISKQKET